MSLKLQDRAGKKRRRDLPEAGRFRFIRIPSRADGDTLAGAVGTGLAQARKSLPCRFFYDEAGSRLFEEICRLPEYYPTRTEEGILQRCAGEIIGAIGGDVALSEFGSGSSAKTRLLIEAILERQERLVYVPIDISAGFLEESARALLERYRRLWLTAIGAEYNDAIPHLPRHRGPRLLLFLGGNIGNLDEPDAIAFLAWVAAEMEPRDRLLVGFDRIKDAAIIEAAYNDVAGITEAFNKNLLSRINRELEGGFDLHEFEHVAPFVAERSRVEMRLVSRRPQTVPVGALGQEFVFREGEPIHTESCHKYTLEVFERQANAAGLRLEELWSDRLDWFSLALLRKGVATSRVLGGTRRES